MNLFEHQKGVLEATKDRNRVAYFLDMGLGKTFVGAEKMIQLGTTLNLVVCQKSKVNDWVEHFRMNYEWVDDVVDLTNKKSFELFSNLTKVKEFPPLYRCVGVINYELAWRRPELLKLADFTMMLDESSLIQNRKAKQTKFILKMKPTNVILLSGTTTAGKYENLWTQAHLIGWDITESVYNSQFVNWETLEVSGMYIKVVNKEDPYKNVDRLKRKFREHGAVFMKTEDVMDLPEQNFIDVKVPTSKEYRKFMKDGIITMNLLSLKEFHDDSDFHGEDVTPRKTLVGDTTLTKRLYARQLSGHYNQDKLNAFRDLLESTNDRLIVFYNFNDELDALKRIAEHLNRPVSIVNGSVKNLDNYESSEDAVTFVQYQAGSMGLNLQKANKIIYFTLPERSELFEQSKKRIHRIGQERPCFYYILKCTGSVEELIHETLNERKDFTDVLFEGIERGSI